MCLFDQSFVFVCLFVSEYAWTWSLAGELNVEGYPGSIQVLDQLSPLTASVPARMK